MQKLFRRILCKFDVSWEFSILTPQFFPLILLGVTIFFPLNAKGPLKIASLNLCLLNLFLDLTCANVSLSGLETTVELLNVPSECKNLMICDIK